MKALSFCGALIGLAAVPALAAPGDVWILGIHHINEPGQFTSYAGAGYDGPMSSGDPTFAGASWGMNGTHGQARIYWELSGLSIGTNNPVPNTAELYTIEFYGTTDGGHNSWQPVESQFNGAGGETYPIEPNIPWAGGFGTNHQYLAADGTDTGNWHPLGPGPQGPSGPEFNAATGGPYMWLTNGSWLYAKWDFGFAIDRTWSAIRVTQITPEPTSAFLLLLGGGVAALRRKRTR
jgi:hypothetical protein